MRQPTWPTGAKCSDEHAVWSFPCAASPTTMAVGPSAPPMMPKQKSFCASGAKAAVSRLIWRGRSLSAQSSTKIEFSGGSGVSVKLMAVKCVG